MLKKLGIAASIAVLYTSSAMADLAGAKGTFNNVDSAINDAVTKAARLFEENHGEKMASTFNVLDKEGNNPYLDVLRITKDYRVELKFAGKAKDGGKYVSPVAKGLLGIDIVLVPVYNPNDEKVTSWECVTNADRNIQEFMGGTAKEYSASYVREASNNTYLSLCVYINKDLVEAK